ncbi:GNAT family N-acetyltransferase [Paenibacillus sp. FA6]|uniref:GNAT family N-acetyltransferase n=1 Tax=Paenibacillus sp. FA6 TaxID=3413029 RepID=UPI003F65D167
MLGKCDSSWKSAILEYIGADYSKCLYLYINLNKYGFDTDFFNVWVSLDDNNRIKGLLAKYYTGIHIYCKSSDLIFNIGDVTKFINDNQPSIVTATGDIIKSIQDYIPDYSAEYGSVGQIKVNPGIDENDVEVASLNDMHEIARLLIEDDGLGGHYDVLLLEHQLKERYVDGFGRNYILKKNDKLISHCATYAQTNDIGVTSGVYTKPEERGNGYASQVYCKLCSDLLKEGKEVFAYFYTRQAHQMHKKIGFEVISSWAKLVKN